MGKIRKKSSKRQTLKVKHKITKKISDNHRKMRKEAKKRREAGILPKARKEPGIPNLYPFKKEMIEQLERQKKRLENAKVAKKLENKKQKLGAGDSTMEGLVEEVKAKVEKYVDESKNKNEDEDNYDSNQKKTNLSKKMYVKELEKVLEAADVILEVLDARDPLGCRNKELELKILSNGKKLVFVLNKIDLIPKENAKAWMRHLRREYPTVLFKCNTQSQGSHLSQTALHTSSLTERGEMVDDLLNSSKSVGPDKLVQLLKNYCRSGDIKTSLTVGVVGFPNVGKSSLINSLKRQRVAAVADTPGHTKAVQEIILDKNLKLLDSPGVVLSKDNADSLILRNVVRIEDLKDPYQPVSIILKKVDKQELIKIYEIANFEGTQEFLAFVAKKRGKLMKGGIPDYDKAARLVLHDWNQGKISFFTNPPDSTDEKNIMIDA